MYWPPQGHKRQISTVLNVEVGGDVEVGGKVYAYVTPEFTADLAPGKYQIDAHKGMEYYPSSQSFVVTDNSIEIEPIQLSFRRWVDMQSEGWIAGDTHVHFLDDHHALLEASAEGLNIISVLATKWLDHITDVHRITGGPSPVSCDNVLVHYNEETRHNFLGHTILHPITRAIYPLTWGDVPEGVAGGGDYPTLAHQADKARAQGGIVTWAHFPNPQGELAIDAALGKIDSVDLVTHGDPFRPAGFIMPGADGSSPIDWYYRLLNTGARLPVSGGTDKMINNQRVGAVRTYAWLGNEKLSYDAWAEAIKTGNTFVTTGPMLSFTVDNHPAGTVIPVTQGKQVVIEASARVRSEGFPPIRLELVHNGKVIAEAKQSRGRDTLVLKSLLSVEGSGWIAARVRSLEDNPAPLLETAGNGVPAVAHSSPIYLELPGDEIWNQQAADALADSASKAVEWARNRANYHREEERLEVMELFQRGRDYYLRR